MKLLRRFFRVLLVSIFAFTVQACPVYGMPEPPCENYWYGAPAYGVPHVVDEENER